MTPWNKEVVIKTIIFPRNLLKKVNEVFDGQKFEKAVYCKGCYIVSKELSKTETDIFLKKVYEKFQGRYAFCYRADKKIFGISYWPPENDKNEGFYDLV